MQQFDSPAADPAQRLDADFKRLFRPTMQRVIKPCTPEEVDAIEETEL